MEARDESHEVPASGPYVAAALICEQILEEKDGVLSAVRIVDRFIVTARGPRGVVPESLPPYVVHLNFLIALKAGSARGRHTVSLRPEKPSGQQMDELPFPILLEGEDRGANLIFRLDFEANEEGLYWFDVLVDGRLMTRIPMRVLYQPVTAGTSSGG